MMEVKELDCYLFRNGDSVERGYVAKITDKCIQLADAYPEEYLTRHRGIFSSPPIPTRRMWIDKDVFMDRIVEKLNK